MSMKVMKKMMHKQVRFMKMILDMNIGMKVKGKIILLNPSSIEFGGIGGSTYNFAIMEDFLAIQFIAQND